MIFLKTDLNNKEINTLQCITMIKKQSFAKMAYSKMSVLTSTILIFFPFSSVPSSFLSAFFKSLFVANSNVLDKIKPMPHKNHTQMQKTISHVHTIGITYLQVHET